MPDVVRYAWAPITKREKQTDGSVIVHGPAADPSLDRDGQRLDPAWLATAFPAWVQESGNIREQHDSKRAVGRAVGYSPDGDVHNIAARVVDPVAVAKIDAEVLQGFSVGIKHPIVAFNDPTAPNGTIVGGSIIEVSVVDRPANPNARFTLAKADSAGTLEVVDAVLEEATVTPEAAAVLAHWDTVKADVALLTGHGIAEQLAVATGSSTDSSSAATDEMKQISDAQTAIAAIARLIQGEAAELAKGSLDETYDISCLLDAANALKYFIRNEQDQAMSKSDTAGADMTEQTTETETSETEPVTEPETSDATEGEETDEGKAQSPDLTKAHGAVDLDMLVKSEAFTNALTAATTAAVTTAVQPLTERLTKIEAAPVPGGPVLTRTAADTALANKADSDRVRRDADELLAKADATDDQYLAQGYRERAKQLLSTGR